EQRYGEVYERLARQADQFEGGYDQSSLMRYLVRQCLPDFEAVLRLKNLALKDRGSLAYHLAEPYQRLGQNRRALALYEQALEIDQDLGDVRGIAVTQQAIANVLKHLGRPQEALVIYEQALCIFRKLDDIRGIAITQ